MDVTYSFAATRGIQAGKYFFTATIPFKFLVRLFTFCDETLPTNLRAQRRLDEDRAKKVAQYILGNRESYVLPALTASVDQTMTFDQIAPELTPRTGGNLGILRIPLTATLLLNDGQHRRAGIELAIREVPDLANESVSVALFYDQGLAASQQMFSDINGNHTKPSSSISALYDLRNPFARWVIEILERRPRYKARIDMEAASPAKNSPDLWSLIAFHHFVTLLTGFNGGNFAKVADVAAATEKVCAFLDELAHIPMWNAMLDGQIPAPTVRERYVIGHAVFLNALGLTGRYLSSLDALAGLAALDPAKDSVLWRDRCVLQGKMRKTTDGVKLTAAQLLKLCGGTLPDDLSRLEDLLSVTLDQAA